MNDFHSASLFSPEDIAARDWDAQDIAVALHGDVDKKGVLAPKEGHSDEDRSLRVMAADTYPDGYSVCSAHKVEGRRPRPNSIVGQFAARLIDMMESPAWRALSPSARRCLERIEIELANHGGRDTANYR